MLKRLFGLPEFPRAARFAGMFYPEDASALAALTAVDATEPSARAVVVPHSDIELVAPVARAAYSQLVDARRAVVIGPSHKIPFAGVAVPNADGWTSPLGTLRIDTGAYDGLEDIGVVRVMDPAFEAEPAIELQVPWLQQRFGDKLKLIPLLCGDANVDDVEAVLDRLLDDETVLVVACEFARDLPAKEVRALDETLLRAICGTDRVQIRRGHATARVPLAALHAIGRNRGWNANVAQYATSTDLGGPEQHAAGYAAISFVPR